MSRAARLVVDRVMIEHMAHAGTENGNLVVTYADFVKFGAHIKIKQGHQDEDRKE